MSHTFPLTRKFERGYDPTEVESFLADVRRAYEVDRDTVGSDGHVLDSAAIRRVSFGLRKHGYSTAHVDAALDRLEDAFSARERLAATQKIGEDEWLAATREKAREILARIERAPRRKFRSSGAKMGYHRDDVDEFAGVLSDYFRLGTPLSVDNVRTVVFRQKRRGYDEAQVDFLLDAVIDVILAVR